MTTQKEQIVGVLRNAEKPMTAKEISNATDIPLTGKWGGIYKLLCEMERSEILKRIFSSPYRWVVE